MTFSTFLNKQIFILLFFLIFVFQPICAETILEKRELAKSSYYSNSLESALFSFQDLAKTGDAESQYYIGLIYLTEGWSGNNALKGIAYLRSAADQSNAAAMWKLGELHESGVGVKKDLLMAIDWYRKSKRSEILKSNIKFIKENNGKYLVQKNSDVIEKIKNNALNNNAEAQFKLANIFDEGKLTEQNVTKAFKWYRTAAKNNHSYSMLITGYMLCRGLGVEINRNEANEWLEKSGRDAHCY